MKKVFILLFALILSIHSWSQVMEQDSLALVALYNSTNGDNWFQKDLWLWPNRPVGEWFGITVENHRVTRIDLWGNNLSGEIPAEIGNLDSLSFMDFSYDAILSLPNTIGQLSTLDTLELFAAEIDTLPPEIGNLNDLKYLNFSISPIRYLPETIGGLEKLELLYGYDSDIHNIPESIGNLTFLKIIYLPLNEIESLPASIGNCTNLTELHLNANHIPEIPSTIGNLVDLEYLILGGNELIELPDEIFTLTNLKYLNFAANDLKYIPPEIGNLTNLQNFQFFKNNFTYIPEEIGNLVNLTYINGYSNRIDSLPLTLLNLPNVQTLFLAYNALTFDDIEPLVSITGFEYDTQDSIGISFDTTVLKGTAFHLGCITGGEFNHYQWLKNGDTLNGPDDSFLEIPSLTYADSGEYRCVVTNSLATGLTLFSRPVRVHVIDPLPVYHGFPETDGYWKEQYGIVICLDNNYLSDICSEYQFFVTGDTSINELVYQKLSYSGRDRNPLDETWTFWDMGYHGCYRNYLPAKQVYFIPKDSTEEVLLYDFDLKLYDTLPESYVYTNEGNFITVDAIDSILLNDIYLKRYHLDNAGFGNKYLIEGIGSTLGLLTYIQPFFEQHYDLLCFENEADGIYFYEYGSEYCDKITGLPEPDGSPGPWEIFPNPAHDIFYLSNSLNNDLIIEIFSISGEKLKSLKSNEDFIKVDISGLNAGMYLLLIKSDSGHKFSKLVKY